MQTCWQGSPDQRPTADELVQVLSQTDLLYEEVDLAGSDAGSHLSKESSCDSYIKSQETQV